MVQMVKQRLKNQRGMTLIELLAVIVILGIIAAIAVPSIGNLIKNTQNKATVAEGIQIIDAAKMYVSEKTPSSGDINKVQLDSYLDNVKDVNYIVTIIKDPTSGKYTYLLKNHGSVALANTDTDTTSLTEQELLNYK